MSERPKALPVSSQGELRGQVGRWPLILFLLVALLGLMTYFKELNL